MDSDVLERQELTADVNKASTVSAGGGGHIKRESMDGMTAISVDGIDGYISQIGKDGILEQVCIKSLVDPLVVALTFQVPVKFDSKTEEVTRVEAGGAPGAGGGDGVTSVGSGTTGGNTGSGQRRPSLNADFMSADIFTKPFNFVAGSVSKRR